MVKHSCGQSCTHAPHCLQMMGFFACLSMAMAPTMHAGTHFSQPIHFFASNKTPPPDRGVSACVGHASAHAGSEHPTQMTAANWLWSPPFVLTLIALFVNVWLWKFNDAQPIMHSKHPMHLFMFFTFSILGTTITSQVLFISQLHGNAVCKQFWLSFCQEPVFFWLSYMVIQVEAVLQNNIPHRSRVKPRSMNGRYGSCYGNGRRKHMQINRWFMLPLAVYMFSF
jgi:hypothetical protein